MHQYDHALFADAQPIRDLPFPRSSPATLVLLSQEALTAADHACWDALGLDSATPSIFAQPWFTRAGLAHCPGGERARLAVVRDARGEWLGVMPLVGRLRYGKAPFPHRAAWDHPNQFRGTPLVRRGEATRFWRTLLLGLDRKGFGRLALRLNSLPLDEPVTRALMQVCDEDGRRLKIDRTYSRAMLSADQPEEADAVKGSRRRRIASLERKAERELGPLAWRISSQGCDVEAALDRFLALERAGWKGKAGSALASASATSGFFAAIATAATLEDRIEIAELIAGDRLLAASVHFVGGPEGFGYKMAYDEALSPYGPGLLLLSRLTAHFRAGPLQRIDSCCAPGQEPIGSLWPERMALIDCGVALGPPLLRRSIGLLGLAEAVYHAASCLPAAGLLS